MSEVNDFSPAEFKPATEFDRAYGQLKRFAAKPVAGITDQYHLERSVKGMADALRTVIQFRGSSTELSHPSGQKSVAQVIEGKIPKSEDSLQAYVESDAIIVSRVDAKGKRVYDLDYPLDDGFSNGEADFSYMATERAKETGIETDFAPAFEPSDPKMQQGYARVLQQSVNDLLSIIEPPVSIPEDVIKQFGE